MKAVVSPLAKTLLATLACVAQSACLSPGFLKPAKTQLEISYFTKRGEGHFYYEDDRIIVDFSFARAAQSSWRFENKLSQVLTIPGEHWYFLRTTGQRQERFHPWAEAWNPALSPSSIEVFRQAFVNLSYPVRRRDRLLFDRVASDQLLELHFLAVWPGREQHYRLQFPQGAL